MIDEFDRRILKSLQIDSSISITSLAEDIGLSPSACHRRVRLLEKRGIIRKYRAVLEPEALGLYLQVFVDIALSNQDADALGAFEAAILRHPEILECWLTAGGSDYELRLMAKDMADFDRIHRSVLASLPGVASMQTRFAMRKIKRWQGYTIK